MFIDTLPDFRPLHPLTWVIPNSDAKQQDDFWPSLEACLSASVKIKVQDVKRRYEDDLRLLRTVLVSATILRLTFSAMKIHSSHRT